MSKGFFMKAIFLVIFITILTFSQSINEQIKALQDATPQKRVDMMNEIKRQLIEMNQEERSSTIEKLRARMDVKHEQNCEASMSEQHQEEHSDNMMESHVGMEEMHQHKNMQEMQNNREQMLEQMEGRENRPENAPLNQPSSMPNNGR